MPIARRLILVSFIFIVGFGISRTIEAQSCSECSADLRSGYEATRVLTVYFDSSINSTTSEPFIEGMKLWNTAFANQGITDRGFRVVTSRPADINVVLDPQLSGTTVGAQMSHTQNSGTLNVNPDYLANGTMSIDIYQFLVHTGGHEFGHALGFMHTASNCRTYSIMAPEVRVSGPYTLRLKCGDGLGIEEAYGDTPEGSPEPSIPPVPCDEPGCSPIVLNFEGGYRFTAPEDGVSFDIDADGEREFLAWTTADRYQPFLARDLNLNGVIDDGSELFGTFTRLSNGENAPNGFVALAEHDSDGNGIIDEEDPIWTELRLWHDENHDGMSQFDEIRSLADSRVLSIDTALRWSGRRDMHGNTFRYRGEMTLLGRSGHALRRPIYDVFFVALW